MGFHPTPRKLFEKSLIKNFNMNRALRGSGGSIPDYLKNIIQDVLPITKALPLNYHKPQSHHGAAAIKMPEA